MENGHQKDTRYKEIGLRAQNIDTIVGSVGNTSGRACVINQRQKRESPPLASHNFRVATPILKLGTVELCDSQFY